MLARLARYEIDPDRCDDAVRSFQESAREVAELDGFEDGYIFVDPQEGRVMTVTVWRDQQALDASEVRAASLRQRAVQRVDGDVDWVHVFDIVREFGS